MLGLELCPTLLNLRGSQNCETSKVLALIHKPQPRTLSARDLKPDNNEKM